MSQTGYLPVSTKNAEPIAPFGLSTHPVWKMLDEIQNHVEDNTHLDANGLKHAVILGWENGLSPIRALYQAPNVESDYLNLLIWSVVHDLQIVNIIASNVDVDLIKHFPLALIKQYLILPLYRNQDHGWPVVAVHDLNDKEGLQAITESFPGEEVHVVLAEKRVIEGIIEGIDSERARSDLALILDGMGEDDQLSIVEEDAEEDDEQQSEISRMIRNLIEQAMRSRVSDIHLDPGEHECAIKFRVDGTLQHVAKHPPLVHQRVINYLKGKSGMDISKSRIPQDGGYKVRFSNGAQMHLRTASIPSDYPFHQTLQEKMTIRLIAANNDLAELNQLGMSPHIYDSVLQLLADPAGMVILCGPTNSGKTTTLYAMLNHMRNDSTNIMTVEDPIEKHIEGINQAAVNVKAGMTYEAALQSFLRHDPDVILVGEIRGDEETVNTAINASLAGKLVLTTIHTSSVVKVPSRLMSMGVEPFTLVDAVRAMVSQRLVRRLCSQCKSVVANSADIIETVSWPDWITPPEMLFRPSGCAWCKGTGYRGRMVAAEILIMNETLEEMILRRATSAELKRESINMGLLRPLTEDILYKVSLGETALHEVALAGGT